MSNNSSPENVSDSNIASECEVKTEPNAVDENDFIKLSDLVPEEDDLPPIFCDNGANMLGYSENDDMLDLDIVPALPTKHSNSQKSVSTPPLEEASKEKVESVAEIVEQAMISSSTDMCQIDTNPDSVFGESFAFEEIVSTSNSVVENDELACTTSEDGPLKRGRKNNKRGRKPKIKKPVEPLMVQRRKRKNMPEPLKDTKQIPRRSTRKTSKYDKEDLLSILQDTPTESNNLQKVIVESAIPNDVHLNLNEITEDQDSISAINTYINDTSSCKPNDNIEPVVNKNSGNIKTRRGQKRGRNNASNPSEPNSNTSAKVNNVKAKPRRGRKEKEKPKLPDEIDNTKIDKSIEEPLLIHTSLSSSMPTNESSDDDEVSLNNLKQTMLSEYTNGVECARSGEDVTNKIAENETYDNRDKLVKGNNTKESELLADKNENIEMEIDDIITEPLLLTNVSSLVNINETNSKAIIDDGEVSSSYLKKDKNSDTVEVDTVAINNDDLNKEDTDAEIEVEMDLPDVVHYLNDETISNIVEVSQVEAPKPTNKRTPKKPKNDDYEYDIDKVVSVSDKPMDDSEVPLYSEDGRPLRKKARQKHYDENSDEDPFANVELSDDECSDAEYLPYKEQKKSPLSDVSDIEIDEVEGNNLKKKRNRAKVKNYSHENKEQFATNTKVVTSSALSDVDNDIENCLKTSVITIPCDDDQPHQDGLSNILGAKKLGAGLEIKKVIPKVGEKSIIPPITIPLVVNKCDISTQTNVLTYQSTSAQTTNAELIKLKNNVPLTTTQKRSACDFLTKILNTTSELGQLMTTKSDEFISKKITPSHIKDTSRIDYCAQKAFLLLKLAKENITSMEETLHSKYVEYLSDNNLSSSFEEPKTITAQSPHISNDSDCEIVEAPVTAKKPKFNPKTVFLNKELSIKIAKKPAVAPSLPKKNEIVKKTHSVWINDSIMVKKVKPQQSFLAKDGRFDKPPDLVTEEQVKQFFDNYYHIRDAHLPYVSPEWFNFENDSEIICNYFSVENQSNNSNDFEESNSEQDVLIEANVNEIVVPASNQNFSFLDTPTKVYEEESRDTKSLLTLCIETLSRTFLSYENQLIKTHSHNTLYCPNSLVRLSLNAINSSTYKMRETNAKTVIKLSQLKESATIRSSLSSNRCETIVNPLSLFKAAFEMVKCCMYLDNFNDGVSDDINCEPWCNILIGNIESLGPDDIVSLKPAYYVKSLKTLALEAIQSCFNVENKIKAVEKGTTVKSLSQIAFENVKNCIYPNNFVNEVVDKANDEMWCNIFIDNVESLAPDDAVPLKPVYFAKSLKLLSFEVLQSCFNMKNKIKVVETMVKSLSQIAFENVQNCIYPNNFVNEVVDKANDEMCNIFINNVESLAPDDAVPLKPDYFVKSLKLLSFEVIQSCFNMKNKIKMVESTIETMVKSLSQIAFEKVKNCIYPNNFVNEMIDKTNYEMWRNIFIDDVQSLAPGDTVPLKTVYFNVKNKIIEIETMIKSSAQMEKVESCVNTDNFVYKVDDKANDKMCNIIINCIESLAPDDTLFLKPYFVKPLKLLALEVIQSCFNSKNKVNRLESIKNSDRTKMVENETMVESSQIVFEIVKNSMYPNHFEDEVNDEMCNFLIENIQSLAPDNTIPIKAAYFVKPLKLLALAVIQSCLNLKNSLTVTATVDSNKIQSQFNVKTLACLSLEVMSNKMCDHIEEMPNIVVKDISSITNDAFLEPRTYKYETINDDYDYSDNIDDSVDTEDNSNWYSQIEVANLRSCSESTARESFENVDNLCNNGGNMVVKTEPVEEIVADDNTDGLLDAMVNIPNDAFIKSEPYHETDEISKSHGKAVDSFEDFVRNDPTAHNIMITNYLETVYHDDSDCASDCAVGGIHDSNKKSTKEYSSMIPDIRQSDNTADEDQLMIMNHKLKEELMEYSGSDIESEILDVSKIVDQPVRSLVPETLDIPEIQCNNVDSTQNINTLKGRKRGRKKKTDVDKASKVAVNQDLPKPCETPDQTSKKDEIKITDTNKKTAEAEKIIEDHVASKKNKDHSSEIELEYIERNSWHCYRVDRNDVKLYSLCSVPLEKLPENFLHTNINLPNIELDDSDLEITRLTNLNSLNRLTREVDKNKIETRRQKEKTNNKLNNKETEEDTIPSDGDYDELLPSDDDYPIKEENYPIAQEQNSYENENTLAKKLLLREDEDSDNEEVKPIPETISSKPGPKSKKYLQLPQDGPLVLTVDKMMKKELNLLHAPISLDNENASKPEDELKIDNQKPSTSYTKTRQSKRQTKSAVIEDDSSSEEEKLWVNTKSKLLKKMEKKVSEQNSIDDARRSKLVTEYLEKHNESATEKRHLRSSRFRRRQRELLLMQMGSNFETVGKKNTSYSKGRKNIRKVLDKKSLAKSTVRANMEEFERKKRIVTAQTRLREMFGYADSVNVVMINDELCLEFDFEKKIPVVTVHKFFTNVMKTHQYQGVKFLWDACFESVAHVASGDPGGGCILAHCMGLGKTLQVLALLHTVLTHPGLGVQRVLVCCPLSTVLNWVDEIHKWLSPITNKIKVFELSKLKKIYERAYQLEDWYKGGGIFIIGYELFRSLSTLDPAFDDVRPTIIEKIRKALLDPGPDIVVCDEGHLLKNDSSVLAIAMSRVKTKRRIVLTGTPMQNNLREYFCMVNFIKPNLLGTYSEYSNRFENPIMNGQHRDSSTDDIRLMKARTHILHKVLEGCLQRQEASVLYPYLPRKYEYTVLITLTKCQSNLYRHYLNEFSRKTTKSVLKDFHILQKIWSHPLVLHNFLVKSRVDHFKVEKLEDDLAREDLTDERDIKPLSDEQWWLQHLENDDMLNTLEASNKFDTVFRILDECVEVNDKVLIFSTSLFTMDALEYFLKKIKKWNLGHEYYRLDGSVPAEVRQKWCREFNCENNTKTKLFLMSTRAGCLGLNMTAANRVILFDTSWNPAHDIQSIFRVYRFGQKKDCYIYRLVAMGTMEQKIYERSVTKQAVACRVVDELQIDRHYNMAELAELYRFEEVGERMVAGIASGVSDVVLLRVARDTNAFHSIHEHDSLLRDTCEQQLPENERQEAWDQFQQEQANKHKETKSSKRTPSEKIPQKKPVPTQEPQDSITNTELDAVKRICLEFTENNTNKNVEDDTKDVIEKVVDDDDEDTDIAEIVDIKSEQNTEEKKEGSKDIENDLINKIASILIKHKFNKANKTDSVSGLAKMVSSLISTSGEKKKNEKKTEDDIAAECIVQILKQHVNEDSVKTDEPRPSTSKATYLVNETPKQNSEASLPNKRKSDRKESQLGVSKKKAIEKNKIDAINDKDVIKQSDAEDLEQNLPTVCIVKLDETKSRRKQLQKIEVQSETVVLSDDDDLPLNESPAVPETAAANVSKPISKDTETEDPVPLDPRLLVNDNFAYIIANIYQKRNPDLDEKSAKLAAEYSIKTALEDIKKNKLITSGPIYDVALQILGKEALKSMWKNRLADNSSIKPITTTTPSAPVPNTVPVKDNTAFKPTTPTPVPNTIQMTDNMPFKHTTTPSVPVQNIILKERESTPTRSQIKLRPIQLPRLLKQSPPVQPTADNQTRALNQSSSILPNQIVISDTNIENNDMSNNIVILPSNNKRSAILINNSQANAMRTAASVPVFVVNNGIPTSDLQMITTQGTSPQLIVSQGTVEHCTTTQSNYKQQGASAASQNYIITTEGNVETQMPVVTAHGQNIGQQGYFIGQLGRQEYDGRQDVIVKPQTYNIKTLKQIVTSDGINVPPKGRLIKIRAPNNAANIVNTGNVYLKSGQNVKSINPTKIRQSETITSVTSGPRSIKTIIPTNLLPDNIQMHFPDDMAVAEEIIVDNTPHHENVVPVTLLKAGDMSSNRTSISQQQNFLHKPAYPPLTSVTRQRGLPQILENRVILAAEGNTLANNNVVPVNLIKANYAQTPMEAQVESILPDDNDDVTINLSSDDDFEISEVNVPQTKPVSTPAETTNIQPPNLIVNKSNPSVLNKEIINSNNIQTSTSMDNQNNLRTMQKITKKTVADVKKKFLSATNVPTTTSIEKPSTIKKTEPSTVTNTRANETRVQSKIEKPPKKSTPKNIFDNVVKIHHSDNVIEPKDPASRETKTKVYQAPNKGLLAKPKEIVMSTVDLTELDDDQFQTPAKKASAVKPYKTTKPAEKVTSKSSVNKRKAQPKTDAVPSSSKKKKTFNLPFTLKDFSLDDIEDIIELE